MTYPHSWRSKKPVIFRNTPQWFVYMDKDFGRTASATTLRKPCAQGHRRHPFVPKAGARTACAA
jgi:isoleucyl-tRNA synthetase